MKRFLAVCVVLSMVSAASATVVLNETFNYADQAALDAAWSNGGTNTVYVLDGFGNAGPSYKMPSPAATLSGRLAKNLGGEYNGTDAEPLVFSFDIYLDAAGAAALWNGARHFVELRGYAGSGYGSGSANSILALGLNNTTNQAGETFSNKWFNARVWLSPDGDWSCLNTDPATPQRSAAWHELKAVIKSTTVDFYVDGVLAETRNRPATSYSFDSVVLGSGLTANGQTVWVDNIKVETVPEPATIALLSLVAVALRRRR